MQQKNKNETHAASQKGMLSALHILTKNNFDYLMIMIDIYKNFSWYLN